MIPQCPHCRQELKFTEAQRAKIEKALAELQSGKILKLGCPQCKKSIEFEGGANGNVLEDVLYPAGGEESNRKNRPGRVQPPDKAPQPPDLGWLTKGDFETGDGWVEDILTALLLIPEGEQCRSVAETFKAMGYQVVVAKSTVDAVERLRFVNYSAIVYHVTFEEGELEDSTFHRHMRNLAMDKRRYIFYGLMGSDFKTLYDLEALGHSANLVINDKELKHLPVILKKGLHDHEELFNPLIMMLREYGKR
jgi:hypothetical protein